MNGLVCGGDRSEIAVRSRGDRGAITDQKNGMRMHMVRAPARRRLCRLLLLTRLDDLADDARAGGRGRRDAEERDGGGSCHCVLEEAF